MSNVKWGFTLIELLIVIAIIGVLAGLLMANFVGVRQRARDGQRKSDLRQIQSALEIYRSDQGLYPLTAAFPVCGNPLTGGPVSLTVTYMQKTPCEPVTGNPVYTYDSPAGITYSIAACLENVNDSQKDASNNSTLCGSTKWSFTLTNP